MLRKNYVETKSFHYIANRVKTPRRRPPINDLRQIQAGKNFEIPKIGLQLTNLG